MATIQEVAPAPWRMKLVPASFAGVQYHVEQQARSGGRRVVLHEYPKRDEPYAEDMGRSAFRYQITGYLVGPRYNDTKRQLMRVLDSTEGGTLMDPYLGEPLKCICEKYSVTETRQRGGYCTFEMQFCELGKSGNSVEQTDSRASATNQADVTSTTAASRLDMTGVNMGPAPSDWPSYPAQEWPGGSVEPFSPGPAQVGGGAGNFGGGLGG
jgi:prophage DNA circulation protein